MPKQSKKYQFKGLDDIFGESVSEIIDSIQTNPIKYGAKKDSVLISEIIVNKNQPRKIFDEESINELKKSIEYNGLIQPIILNQNKMIVAGERRFKAIKALGWKDIPAIVLDLSDQQVEEYSIIENVQRVDLSAIEEAKSYKNLTDKFKMTQEDIATKVGKSRSHIANISRLLGLPEYIQSAMLNNEISMGQAKPLLSIVSKPEKLKMIFNLIISKNLTAREVENLVKKYNDVKEVFETKIKNKNPDVLAMEDKLIKKFKTVVSIEDKKLIIKYSGIDELNRILEILNVIDDN